MSIVDLRQEPQHLDTLAQWHFAEWSYLNPGESLAQRQQRMHSYLAEETIPSTYVYRHEGQLAGSAAIVHHDMDTHGELSPWLASVYVKPELRGKGIGSQLVRQIMRVAAESGIKELFLFTDGGKNFYARLGWTVWAEETYRNCKVTIMRAVLQK